MNSLLTRRGTARMIHWLVGADTSMLAPRLSASPYSLGQRTIYTNHKSVLDHRVKQNRKSYRKGPPIETRPAF